MALIDAPGTLLAVLQNFCSRDADDAAVAANAAAAAALAQKQTLKTDG